MSFSKQIWRFLTKGDQQPPTRSGKPRILAHCASNIGLGHYARLSRVLHEVKLRRPDISILLVTDARDKSLASQAGIAVLNLPGFQFLDDGSFQETPTNLDMSNRELRNLRANVLLSICKTFAPDLVFMDTNPHGKRDEALPMLRYLRRGTRVKTVLMMRDIPARPGDPFKLMGETDRVLKHAGYYDRFLMAGDAAFFDAPTAYEWPEALREKTRYVGFVVPTPDPGRKRAEVLARYSTLDAGKPLLLISFGGGWDADRLVQQLMRAFEAGKERWPDLQLLLVTGPAIGDEAYRQLRRATENKSGVAVEKFVPDFHNLLQQADFAILQAGSSVFQILDSSTPILLLCRDYRDPEQQERAMRLAALPGIRVVDAPTVSEQTCGEWISWTTTQPRVPRSTGFSFQGTTVAADELIQTLPSR